MKAPAGGGDWNEAEVNVVGKVRTQVTLKLTGLGQEVKFILSVIGSNWETLSKAEIPSDVFKKIKIKTLLTALLRKDFKEAA